MGLPLASANHPPLALMVKMREHPGPIALYVVGWSWNDQRQEGEAVVALGDGVCAALSRLDQHGVVEVLGLGPVESSPPPRSVLAVPSGVGAVSAGSRA